MTKLALVAKVVLWKEMGAYLLNIQITTKTFILVMKKMHLRPKSFKHRAVKEFRSFYPFSKFQKYKMKTISLKVPRKQLIISIYTNNFSLLNNNCNKMNLKITKNAKSIKEKKKINISNLINFVRNLH